jgi:hypothetical protein
LDPIALIGKIADHSQTAVEFLVYLKNKLIYLPRANKGTCLIVSKKKKKTGPHAYYELHSETK